MKALRTISCSLLIAFLIAVSGVSDSGSASASDRSDKYFAGEFSSGFRWVPLSGYAGRAGQYTSLSDSLTGKFDFTFVDRSRGVSWKFLGDYLTHEDYRFSSTLHQGDLVTLTLNARSFVKHPDKLLFGPNFSADDMFVTDTVPDTQLFTTRRTFNSAKLQVKVPRSPITFFVKAEEQFHKGDNQARFFDMGANQASPPTCDSCHLAIASRAVDYVTRRTGFGSTIEGRHVSLTYEHILGRSVNHVPPPTDAFGATLGSEEEPLPPGAADTLPGDLIHNVIPGHKSHSDILTMHALLTPSVTMNCNLTNGRTTDTFTGNEWRFFNAYGGFNANLSPIWSAALELRQDSTVNEFTPSQFPEFPNTSIRRFLGTLRLTRKYGPDRDLQFYYKRPNISRSNAGQFPQVFSPENADVLHVVPRTFGNTVGMAFSHSGARSASRYGYEWSSVDGQGYLTDPGLENRIFYDLTLNPKSSITITNDLSMIWQRRFPSIERRNNLFNDNLSVSIAPRKNWSLNLAYAYGLDDLKTDITYGTDPLFVEQLVPFKGVFQNYAISSKYDFSKKLSWTASASYIPARSGFSPSLANPDLPVVLEASDFARVDSPQTSFGTLFSYKWKPDHEAGARLEYLKYSDNIHTQFSGVLRVFDVYYSQKW